MLILCPQLRTQQPCWLSNNTQTYYTCLRYHVNVNKKIESSYQTKSQNGSISKEEYHNTFWLRCWRFPLNSIISWHWIWAFRLSHKVKNLKSGWQTFKCFSKIFLISGYCCSKCAYNYGGTNIQSGSPKLNQTKPLCPYTFLVLLNLLLLRWHVTSDIQLKSRSSKLMLTPEMSNLAQKQQAGWILIYLSNRLVLSISTGCSDVTSSSPCLLL